MSEKLLVGECVLEDDLFSDTLAGWILSDEAWPLLESRTSGMA